MGTDSETPPPSWLRVVAIGRNPKFTFVRIVIMVVGCYLISHFVLLPIHVEGVSMLPTYRGNRVNFLNRLAYFSSEPKRGDVVGIRLAGPSVMYLKRIIALPGETIAFHYGQTLINGRVLEEPYLKYSCSWEIPPETLGPEEYYVVGDNRSMPAEDHTKGRAGRQRIVGRILL